MRLFIALELETQVKRELERLQNELRRICADGVSYPKAEQLHLTLKFLGEVAAEQVSEVKEALSSATSGVKPFELRIAKLGSFPEGRPARVVWAGTEEIGGSKEFERLWRNLETELQLLDFEAEEHGFSPHITLARVKTPVAGKMLSQKMERVTLNALTQCVNRCTLFQSELKSSGAVHTPLLTAEFR
jgi:RNA 2',3'-cyclic 3'-phosphodiesterase